MKGIFYLNRKAIQNQLRKLIHKIWYILLFYGIIFNCIQNKYIQKSAKGEDNESHDFY